MGGKKESGESTVATPDLNNYPLISRRCRGSLSIILECVEQSVTALQAVTDLFLS